MGNQIKFGSRIFPAKGLGKLDQPKLVESTLRFSTCDLVTSALTAVNVSIATSATIPVSASLQYISINQLFITATLFDSSASAQYDCSDAVQVRPSEIIGLDTNVTFAFLPKNVLGSASFGMRVGISSGNNIVINFGYAGGTVERLTGVTLGAGDQVSVKIGISYFS